MSQFLSGEFVLHSSLPSLPLSSLHRIGRYCCRRPISLRLHPSLPAAGSLFTPTWPSGRRSGPARPARRSGRPAADGRAGARSDGRAKLNLCSSIDYGSDRPSASGSARLAETGRRRRHRTLPPAERLGAYCREEESPEGRTRCRSRPASKPRRHRNSERHLTGPGRRRRDSIYGQLWMSSP